MSSFKIDRKAAVAPDIFKHHFIEVIFASGRFSTAGTIVVGDRWSEGAPFWRIVHGHCGDIDSVCISDYFLTYLGPTWRPEYAQLSDAVFKKLSAKPLKRFIKHP